MTNTNNTTDKPKTKTQIKQDAQDRLLHAMIGAFYAVGDDDEMSDDDKNQMIAAMSNQMKRVEKMFGYVPGSCPRG